MKRILLITIITILLVVLCIFLSFFFFGDRLNGVLSPLNPGGTAETEQMTDSLRAVQTGSSETEQQRETEPETEDKTKSAQEAVYTFLQGPVAWSTKVPYSGEWCEAELDGGLFSVFGCGFCDMANLYSTMTPYECSPLDMYYYARKVSDYSPGDGAGAIDWPFIKAALEKAGFGITLHEKDKTYHAFQKAVSGCETCIVLVSSQSDDTYWQDTPGHYVNIWLYDPKEDTVFLADSGSPSHNRTRVPLRYLYNAIAHDSPYGYLTADSYDESRNTWRYSGIHEAWTKPSWYTPKPEREAQ